MVQVDPLLNLKKTEKSVIIKPWGNEIMLGFYINLHKFQEQHVSTIVNMSRF